MKYTPSEIKEKGLFYSIPIYQRLFEWNTENIITLLEDLKKASKEQGDYYIGMLTSTNSNELVDGQQRFTVMLLLGCVLQKYYDEWKGFLIADNKTRISFTSRPSDNTYIRFLIEHTEEENRSFKNAKMWNGIKQIREFIDKEFDDNEKKRNFSKYIFEHLSFFISKLPDEYSPRDLNKYFERMNTSGKNLEQHEILKVKLLSKLDKDIDRYMLLWNKLADVETLLIRGKEDDELKRRKEKSLNANIDIIISQEESPLSDMKETGENDETRISDIAPSESAPHNNRESNKDSRCAITFPYLLLQVLYRMQEGKIETKIDDFFKASNLLSTFEKYLPYNGEGVKEERIKEFMAMLTKARLVLDICFIRPTEYGYSLDMNLSEDDDCLKKLLMLQSMIYVSSSNYTNYRWFNWMMDIVEENSGIPGAKELYDKLKEKVDIEFKLPALEELTYNKEIRYWFWRLDLHIWEQRNELFKDKPEMMRIANNYIFRRNRSIEHIAPQTPQSTSNMVWKENNEDDEKLRDCFGNLVMISQGLNSSLQNESYEVKREHVKAYCNDSKSGSIESLKLLVAYKDHPDGWTIETIKEHGEKMYKLLKEAVQTDNKK